MIIDAGVVAFAQGVGHGRTVRGDILGLGLHFTILFGLSRVWQMPGAILQILGQRAHCLWKRG